MGRKGESIFRRNDGRYEARYIKNYIGDTARYGYIYGHTYSEVKEKRRRVMMEKEHKSPTCKGRLSVYILRWLEFKKDKIKLSSYATYANKIKKQIYKNIFI